MKNALILCLGILYSASSFAYPAPQYCDERDEETGEIPQDSHQSVTLERSGLKLIGTIHLPTGESDMVSESGKCRRVVEGWECPTENYILHFSKGTTVYQVVVRKKADFDDAYTLRCFDTLPSNSVH